MKTAFKIYLTDDRFPDIQVYNEGTIKFFVVKDKKKVDSFEDFEMANCREISLTFAQARAEKFFDYLAAHSWLLRAYSSKHI